METVVTLHIELDEGQGDFLIFSERAMFSRRVNMI